MKRIKILHVEDSEFDAEQVQRVITRAGIDYDYCLATNAQAYITALSGFNPDLVIADHSLPAFNSEEAFRLLKQTGKNVPFILVTGTVSEEYAVQVMRSGVDDYLLKDRLQRLPNAITTLLEKYSREQERRELIKKQAHLAAIVNFSEDAIISKTFDGTITSWNNGAESLFGYRADEAIGKNIFMLFPADRLDEEVAIMNRVKSGENLQHFETVRLTKAGKPVDISHTISPLKDEQGNIIGASKIARDITEQKRAAAQLKQSEAHLVEAQAIAHMGNWEMDLVNNTESWSAELYRIYGIEQSNALQSITNFIHPQDMQTVVETMQGDMQRGESRPIHFRFIRPDGEVRFAYIEWRLDIDNTGKVTRLYGVTQDITEKKKAAQQLEDAHNKLRFHIENTPLGYIEWDNRLRIKSISKQAEQIFGWTEDIFEAEQKSGYAQVFTDDLLQTNEVVQQLLSGAVERNTSINRNYTSDGRVIWCEWFNSIQKNEQGEVETIMSLVQDITERKKAEEEIRSLNENLEQRVKERTGELQAVNSELEAFTYTVSHDLQSPLRSVNGFSKILLRDYSDLMDDSGKDMLGIIDSSAMRMSHLIHDLLHFARMGKAPLQKKVAVDMNELVSATIDEIKFGTPGFNATINTGELSPALCDGALLRQVWANLIGNAVKYSSKKEKPLVEIGMTEQNNEPVYFVKDNGAGFCMEQADRLFGVFQRMHTQEEFQGTGVGLATVQKLIARHEGRIWAEAKENEGATFYFTLPDIQRS